jgi:cytochrome c553
MQLSVIIILSLASFAFPLYAADPVAGKTKAAICMACHGVNGISNNDMWPNLAGQKKGYLVLQIKAYKSGQRKDAMMMPMVKGLSEVDIEDIAAYYSSMTP